MRGAKTLIATYAAAIVLALGSAAPAAEIAPAAAEAIAAELRVAAYAVCDITLPPGESPAAFSVAVPRGGRIETLALTRTSVRGRKFQVLAQVAGGAFVELAPPPARTYRGAVRGAPGDNVAASLLPCGLSACVLSQGGGGWAIRPLRFFDPAGPRERHIVYALADVDLPPCGCEHVDLPSAPPPSQGAAEGRAAKKGGCTLSAAAIAFDSDYEYLERKCGGDTDLAVAVIEDGLNIANLIYIRDVRITHPLSAVVLRTDPLADFYAQFPDASDFGAMLSAFRAEWNANMKHIDRDLAYLVTGKPKPNYGGLAWVKVVCSNYAYGMGIGGLGYEDIFRHEAGHNWGAGHSCGEERRFIMCGNSIPAFSAHNIRVIRAFRDTLGCLEETTYEAAAAPPYVRLDPVVMTQGDGALSVDVLDGDTDINCDLLTLAASDARSARGAHIRVVDTPSPDGREALLFSPRADFAGTDWFGYTAGDGTGFDVEGVCTVKVLSRGLIGYFPFEETAGTDTADASGFHNDGELRGKLDFATHSVPGRFGAALELKGVESEYVSLGDVALYNLRRGITVAAWFTVAAFSGANETLARKGSGGWRLKRDGTAPTLEFACGGVFAAGGAEARARGTQPVDDGAWHHAAGVYDGAALYLYIDGVLDASVPASGMIAANTDSVRFGANAWNGIIDEVRVYNYGLSAAEIAALFENGRVENPDPPHGARDAIPGAALTWQAPPDTSAYDVYLGADAAAVAAATPASPEYKGRRSETSFPAATRPETSYAWRVDPIAGGKVRRGDVRSFTTCAAHTDFNDPPRNAASYTPQPGDTEIGFASVWRATSGANPFVGTVNTTTTPTTPIFSHRSVAATTTFAPVALPADAASAVSLMLQVRDTGYEEGDLLDVYATDGAEALRLVRVAGGSALTQLAGRDYAQYAALLPAAWSTARLVLATSSDSSSGKERYDFDRVAFFRAAPYARIAGTDFAEPAVGAVSYDPGASGTEIGFATTWSPTAGAAPLAGVGEGAGPHRPRFFAYRSVAAATTFREVDLRGWEAVFVRVTLRIRATSYESADKLEIYAANGGERRDLVNVRGNTGLNGFAHDVYFSLQAEIPDAWDAARLVIASSTDSSDGSERFDICRVEFLSRCATCAVTPPEPLFRRGDANADGKLDISDAIFVLAFLFGNGKAPGCADAADANDDGRLDIADTIAVLGYLFTAAVPLPAPFGACGADPTGDALDCAVYAPCGTGA